MSIELGKFNQLEVVKEVDFGVYLDGGEEGEILLPTRYVPEDCKIGDVVFCKVRGSCVTHKVYAIDLKKGCLIGNNKGHMNGWTKNVYGLAHKID